MQRRLIVRFDEIGSSKIAKTNDTAQQPCLYPSGQAGPWCLFCMVLFWQTLLAQSFMQCVDGNGVLIFHLLHQLLTAVQRTGAQQFSQFAGRLVQVVKP